MKSLRVQDWRAALSCVCCAADFEVGSDAGAAGCSAGGSLFAAELAAAGAGAAGFSAAAGAGFAGAIALTALLQADDNFA